MADGTTAGPTVTPQNPYGLTPGMQALQGGLQGLSNAINPQGLNSAAYQRQAPAAPLAQGSPSADELLMQILQMRQAATQGLGDPYQAGVAMPRVSLLQG
jgi:hypothetical protein